MTRAERRDDAWTPRPLWARAVCLLATGVPALAGAGTAIALSRVLPPTSTLAGTVLRVLLIVAASTAAVFVVDRAARRLLPLAALYRLSLVFPDHAPSRFRTALKAGSSRRVERLVDETRRHGLPSDAGEAARRVVELITAIGDHDRRTRGHSERVRLYADLIGEELHLSKLERQKLQWAALLHDLGKLTVPGEILNKKGAPTTDEWHVLRTHPGAGERLVLPLRDFLGSWADAVGGHHEWWNGTGYPRQLRGDQISRSAAIVAVADAYEVMTAVRSYKKSMPSSAARGELARGAGVQFSPEVVRAFLGVSLGKLRWASGPAAALAQIPYLGSAVRFPATVGTAIQSGGSIATAAGPSVAALMVATTAVATSIVATPNPHTAHKAQTYAFAESDLASKTPGNGTAAASGAVDTNGDNDPGVLAATSTTFGTDSNAGAAAQDVTNVDTNDPASLDPGGGSANVAPETPTSLSPPPDPVVADPVAISIGDVSTPEGDTGTRVMSFPVTLSAAAATTVTVQYSVSAVTATVGAKANAASGVEVKARTGTLTFPATATTATPVLKRIGVTIRSDTVVEPDETYTVTLSDPVGATLQRAVATGTILNDDGITTGVTVGIGGATLDQPPARTVNATIPVWLSGPSADTVSVSYEITDGTAKWSARAKDGGDYGGTTAGVLVFGPGIVMQNIPLKLWAHSDLRPDRTFTITLTASDGSTTIVRAAGTFTIYGD